MPSILSLPPEIVQEICQHLCPHYTPGTVVNRAYAETTLSWNLSGPESQRNLISLSYTCKSLYESVQPFLWHSPVPNYGNCIAFVRTLAQRPDLASLIKDLRVVEWITTVGDVTRDDAPIFEDEILHRLKDPFPGAEQSLIELPGARLLRELADTGGDAEGNAFKIIPILAVALASNIERLYFGFNFWVIWPLLPNSLLNLKELVISFGCDSGKDLGIYQHILDAAPALTTIHACTMHAATGASHLNVTELYLMSSNLGRDDLFSIMSNFPRLQTFLYESHGAYVKEAADITPAEASAGVFLRKNTLEHLSLSFATRLMGITGYERDLGDLTAMRALESLEINSHLINQYSAVQDIQLERFPPSLKRLTITVRARDFDHIVSFATAAVRKLRTLEELKICRELTEEHRRPIEDACKAANVSFVYGSGSYRQRRWLIAE